MLSYMSASSGRHGFIHVEHTEEGHRAYCECGPLSDPTTGDQARYTARRHADITRQTFVQ